MQNIWIAKFSSLYHCSYIICTSLLSCDDKLQLSAVENASIGHKTIYSKYHMLCEIDPIPETWIKQSEPIFDPASEIGSPESGLKTRINPIRTISDPKFFYKIAYFCMTSILDQKSVNPNLTWTNWPKRTQPELETWPDLNLIRSAPKSNDPFVSLIKGAIGIY